MTTDQQYRRDIVRSSMTQTIYDHPEAMLDASTVADLAREDGIDPVVDPLAYEQWLEGFEAAHRSPR